MKKSRFSEDQIIGMLKQHESGVKTADVCREHGISAATFYQWNQKYGGMDVNEAQRLEADTSLGSGRVTRVLERVIAERGRPDNLRSDNGPEFTSRRMLAWAGDWKVGLVHIQPGRPMQNGHVESLHGRLRDECLNTSWFRTLNAVRRSLDSWREEYNCDRPPQLARLPHAEGVQASLNHHNQHNQLQNTENTSYEWLRKRGQVTVMRTFFQQGVLRLADFRAN